MRQGVGDRRPVTERSSPQGGFGVCIRGHEVQRDWEDGEKWKTDGDSVEVTMFGFE